MHKIPVQKSNILFPALKFHILGMQYSFRLKAILYLIKVSNQKHICEFEAQLFSTHSSIVEGHLKTVYGKKSLVSLQGKYVS